MSLIRDTAYAVAAVASSPVWMTSLLKTGKWRTDWAGRFGRTSDKQIQHTPASPPVAGTLLIHAVSVGEVNAIRQLVTMFEREHSQVNVVIATTTNTGFARATDLFGEDHDVVRYPFDFGPAVRRFLDRVQPDVVALVELELWPNFAEACKRRGIALAVINGRLSERSFKRYKLIRPLVANAFAALDRAGVQTQAYAERFTAMGANPTHVQVMDTMKWDTAQVTDDVPGAAELAEQMHIDRTQPLLVAGSTGPDEERWLIDAWRSQGLANRGVQLMLVPRKPERFEQVATLESDIVRRTQPQTGSATGGLFLLDTMGELRKAYALADVAIVGRSFLGLYGSDVMEPAALGKPVIIGPHHSDFQDTVDAMREAGGLLVTDAPMREAAQLLNDPPGAEKIARAGRSVILSRQGATHRYAKMLLDLLPNV